MNVAEFFVDDILASEVRSPGSDHRYGINVVSYPPAELVAYIVSVQDQLKSREPDQYYYPPGDLHLTVLELASGFDRRSVEKLLNSVLTTGWCPVAHHSSPCLRSASLRYDERACALVFSEVTGLAELRAALAEKFVSKGIALHPRYRSTSAHLTFMRYIRPVRSGLKDWTETLDAVPKSDNQAWKMNEIWLTAGATWYGMHSRIQKYSSYRVA
ncbi:MAG: hypothetical protein HY870_19370 [Chloroflexi bacterium]|nr:hypothetical protein [Chloroflexota bacterium]